MKIAGEKIEPGFWIGLILVIVLLGIVNHCKAQKSTAHWDTIPARVEAIHKYITKTTAKGSQRIYCVYSDTQSGISDIISVPKSTWDYLSSCKEVGIKPQLGLRFRNGEVYSLIRIKKKYKVR